MKNPLTIDGPDYEMLQLVWLLYGEQAYPTSVRRRAYDPDTERWIYLLGLTGRWHTAEELGPRDKDERYGPELGLTPDTEEISD